MQIDDLQFLGISRPRLIIAIIYPYHDAHSKDCPASWPGKLLVECISVASVRTITSKDITDLVLLLSPASISEIHSPN